MENSVAISIAVHAAPARAEADEGFDAVSLLFTDGHYPRVTMFVGDAALAKNLTAAINGALEQHRQAAQAEAA